MQHRFIDRYSGIDSILHRLHPTAKLLSLFIFILFIVTTPPVYFLGFGLYGGLLIALILLSRIPLGAVLKRAMLVLPFSFFIAIFIPFMKTGRVLYQIDLSIIKISITYEGLIIFWNIVIKSFLSSLCMLLLVSITSFPDLLKSLEKLYCPKIFILIFSFLYRYIFILSGELHKMLQAKNARSAGGGKLMQIKALANMLGVLFIRSYERGENVYLAMMSRGYEGEIRTTDNNKASHKDFIFIFSFILILGFIRFI